MSINNDNITKDNQTINFKNTEITKTIPKTTDTNINNDTIKENIITENIITENITTENIITENITKENIIKENIIKNILVISGGSIRGFAALGALQYLYDKKKLTNITTFCGSSVGAITLFLLLIGYRPIEIYNILFEIDFKNLLDYDIDTLLDDNCFGLYTSNKIMYIISVMVKKKNISLHITFKQLYEKINKTLIITGVCLNDISLHYFSHENNPDMEVLTAIRITMAIPIFFKPVHYDNKVWIDGGCLNNFPIDLFDHCLENVIGICLCSNEETIDSFDSMQDYFSQITKCLLQNVFKINIKKYEKYIIQLKVDNNNWSLDKNEKQKLYNDGYNFEEKLI